MPAPKNYSVRNLMDHVGHDFGESKPILVDQVRINTFADVTEDHQWIHVDVAKAKEHSPFGGPIAHGFLTLSLVAAAVQNSGVIPSDAQGVVNYGVEKVRFLAPVLSGAQITASFKLGAVEAKGDKNQVLRVEFVVNIVGSDKPAMVGESLAMVIG